MTKSKGPIKGNKFLKINYHINKKTINKENFLLPNSSSLNWGSFGKYLFLPQTTRLPKSSLLSSKVPWEES